jgi:transcriptional regulator with XRE-family HTH domain
VTKEIGFRSDRLKQQREHLNLSQRELARRCGFSEALIRKYEEGISDPAGYFLKMISENLNVSSDYLLGLTNDPRGHLGDAQVADEEKEMIEMFRREGWPGVIGLGVERLSKPPAR